jgi:hypothetical protein
MPQYPIQTNLTAGEFSPRMALRVDFAKYPNGVETLENYIVLPQGGVTRAPGTRYVAEVKDSSKSTRLIPFEFSTTQAYMLEFGNQYIRFYRDGGRIGSAITGAVDNGGGLIRLTSTTHGLVTGDTIYVASVGGVPNATGAWTVTVITANTFDLIASTFAGLYTSGGTWVVEVITQYLEADLFDIKYAQSADTLYLVHSGYPVVKLTRTTHTTWALSAVTFIDGPYFDENLLLPNSTKSTVTITPSAATGAIILTASAPLFTAAHVGRRIRLLDGSVWGYGVVTFYTDSTHVNFTVAPPTTLTAATAKSTWRFGAWYTGNYPGAICFFEERLAFAGSVVQPQAVWLSVTGDYEDMTPGANDDDALTYVLASRKVNAIIWLADSVGLLIGTVGGEFAMFGGNDSPLTPTNVTVRKQSTRGSLGVSPVEVGNSLLFVQRAGRKIRELNFDANTGAYKSPDLTLLAEHITDGFIVEMAYQQEPDSIVWCVINDGRLVSFTYNPEQEVIAFGNRLTDGRFESVATIPNPDATGDQTWIIVNRTINGSTKRYVEYMDPTLFVDCGLSYDGVAVGSVSGLSHLETETVDIVTTMDGVVAYAVYPQAVVASGAVTLDGPTATMIQVGLHYTPRFVTLRPEVKMHNGGTSQGRKKRWVEVFARLFETSGLTINGDEMPFRTGDDPMDEPPPLFTGDKRVTAAGGWNREGQLTFVQNQPLPSTILGYFGTLDVGEDSE